MIDFGLARFIGSRSGENLIPKDCLGSGWFKAPELFIPDTNHGFGNHKEPDYDEKKVDSFAAAVALFYLMVHWHPWKTTDLKSQESNPYKLLQGNQKNREKFWKEHVIDLGHFYNLRSDGSEVITADFKDFFERCVALDPKDRLYISCEYDPQTGEKMNYDTI